MLEKLALVLPLLFLTHLTIAAPSHKTAAVNDEAAGPAAPSNLTLTDYPEGTLVEPRNSTCKTLKVYFPGLNQELKQAKNESSSSLEHRFDRELLYGSNYHLAPAIEKAGCPVFLLGKHNTFLGTPTLTGLLAKVGAQNFEVLSHSGGHQGLSQSLKVWPQDLVAKISKVKLLDNFYGSELAATMKSRLGSARSAEICSGFYTAHNQSRYKNMYKGICPAVRERDSHKGPVKEFF